MGSIHRIKLSPPRGRRTGAWGSVPDDADVIATHVCDGGAPLYIYYEQENSDD